MQKRANQSRATSRIALMQWQPIGRLIESRPATVLNVSLRMSFRFENAHLPRSSTERPVSRTRRTVQQTCAASSLLPILVQPSATSLLHAFPPVFRRYYSTDRQAELLYSSAHVRPFPVSPSRCSGFRTFSLCSPLWLFRSHFVANEQRR